jgi:hypothetical protein
MDWKYAHFAQEAVFQAQREPVLEAAREFLAEALVGWRIPVTAEGLEAIGRIANRAVTAKFRIEPASGGTRVTVTLQVARSSSMGYLLYDVVGFYDGQIHHWLEGIRTYLQHGPSSANPKESAELRKQAVARSRRGERLFMGCIAISLLVIAGVYGIVALIGLLTGSLYIPANNGGETIHGRWARVLSAIILLFFGWIAYRIWKPKKRNRGSGWLPPPSR